MRVLITGAAGTAGQVLARGLPADEYELRLLDLRPVPGLDIQRVDITEYQPVLAATQSMDAVVHLAGESSPDAPWDRCYQVNVRGTQNVYEAARAAHVQGVVLASTARLTLEAEERLAVDILEGRHPPIDHRTPARPRTPYEWSKLECEQIARRYAEQYGLSSICLRIGVLTADDTPAKFPRHFRTYLSHRDFLQLVRCSLAALTRVRFEIVYGISRNSTHRIHDLQHARVTLGYEPQDDSKEYLYLLD